MPVITIPKPLRDKLGEEAAEGLVEVINEVTRDAKNNTVVLVEEKYERRLGEEHAQLDKRITDEAAKLDKSISEETAKLDKRITEETAKLDKSISDEAARLRVEMAEGISKLRVETAYHKAEIIKWMFIFWVGQIVVIAGLIAGLIKFIR